MDQGRRRRKDRDRERDRRVDSGFMRVLGHKKDSKESASINPSRYDSLSSSHFTGFMHIFSGEKKEDRSTRLCMAAYRQLLQADMRVVEKAVQLHTHKQESLHVEFKEQEMQLWRWGLEHLIEDFRMQSWMRQDRGELLIDMSKHVLTTIQRRIRDINAIVTTLGTKPSKRLPTEKERLALVGDQFYMSPERLLEEDAAYMEKRIRLLHFDRLCHTYSLKFRELLPELNSKPYQEREAILQNICSRYAELLDDRNLSIDTEVSSTATWPEFCEWYMDRCKKENEIYSEFLRFVDDEREREGRLFRRWCNLVKSLSTTAPVQDSAESSISRQTSNVSTHDTGSQLQKTPQKSVSKDASTPSDTKHLSGTIKKTAVEGNAAFIAHPKAVQTFIRYFALNVLSSHYSLPEKMKGVLVALTDVIVHRNVYDSLFRYPSLEMKRLDRQWRVQCYMCRFIDPLSYAVEPKYLGRSPSSPSSSSEGSLHTEQLTERRRQSIRQSVNLLGSELDRSSHSHSPPESELTSLPVSEEFKSWSENDIMPSGPYGGASSGAEEQKRRKSQPNLVLFQTVLGDPEPTDDADETPSRTVADSAGVEGSPPPESRESSRDQLQLSTDSAGGRKTRRRSASKLRKVAACEVLLSKADLGTLSRRIETLLSRDYSAIPSVSSTIDRSDGSSTNECIGDTSCKPELPIAPYAIPSRVLGLIHTSVCPRDIVVNVLLAMIWLTRTAHSHAGKTDPLGADTIFPLLVHVLINANIPCIHLLLHYVTAFAVLESFGEAAYYITCLTAAVQFIDSIEVPEDIQSRIGGDLYRNITYSDSDPSSGEEHEQDDCVVIDESGNESVEGTTRVDHSQSEAEALDQVDLVRQQEHDKAVATRAVQHLGEWLRDQQVMEDTMVVMMQEGWMG
mmetsp:Transcript_4587/g.7013  ORF Transcript_4587/g.7013 Transcript_4587/m.7013 type:complete len:904 (-) Transcript_4587:171-2882(-)